LKIAPQDRVGVALAPRYDNRISDLAFPQFVITYILDILASTPSLTGE
jgi:hypothetical protein